MLITKRSMVSGIDHTIDLNVTTDQLAAFEAGAAIQDAFPHLTPDDREFLLTGITAEEWATQIADNSA